MSAAEPPRRHFSAFLMDDQLQPQTNARLGFGGNSRGGASGNARTAADVNALTSAALLQARMASTSASAMRRAGAVAADDIPVLESTRSYSFFSDGEDDDDDDEDEGVDEEDVEGADKNGELDEADDAMNRDIDIDIDEEEVVEFDEQRDLLAVPVLQTREEAHVQTVLKKARNGPVPSASIPSRLPRMPSWRTPSRTLPPGPEARALAITAEDSMNMRFGLGPTASLESHGSFAHTNSTGSMSSTGQSNKNILREVIKSGWLVRKGQHLKTWKRRFFVLLKCTNLTTGEYAASLQYYKGNNFSRRRGEIDLHDGPLTIRFVDMNERRRPYCFEIVHREFSLICQGQNDEDVTAWVCHLQYLSGHDVSVSAIAASNPALQRLGSTGVMDTRMIYVLSELRRLLCRSASTGSAKSMSFGAKCTNFARTFECRNTGSLQKMRDLHVSITQSILKAHGSRILAATMERTRNDASLPPFKGDDLRALTSRHVEEVLFSRVQDSIQDFLRGAYGEDDSAVNRKLRWLQGKDQTYFNIPMDHLSRKSWIHAAKCLGQLNSATMPTTKFEILVATIEEIRATHAEEHDKPLDENTLETDDMVPIFTYVLANSGADNLISAKVLLTELNGATTVGHLAGGSDALDIFNFAVEFINEVTIPSALEDLFKDQVTLSIDSNWQHVLELETEPTYRCGATLRQISQQASNAIGSTLSRGHVLVTVNGQNVALWPFDDVVGMLNQSAPPHRLAFIPCNSYLKILTTGKALWNVALTHAAQRGDISSVQMLLANGADVNYVAYECGGNTPLHIAASALHFNVVSFLLQHGAKVKSLGESGRSALHMLGAPCALPSAALSDNALMMLHGGMGKEQTEARVALIAKKLINHGAILEATDIFGNTPLMLLAEKGYTSAIEAMLDADARIDVNARNWQEGMSALALSARGGHYDVVEMLLDNGAQPNLATLRGDSPLHFAASIANKSICQALISRGCNIDERNIDGITPFMVAVSKGSICGISLQDARKRQLDMQSHLDDLAVFQIIDFMMDAGADVCAACRYFRLPLHYAAMFGGSDVLEYLSVVKMKLKPDPQIRDLYGKTPRVMSEARKAEDALLARAGEEATGEEENDDSVVKELQASTQRRRDSGTELTIEDGDNGARVVVAGTLDALLRYAFDSGAYQLEDALAMIWIFDGTASLSVVEFLHNTLRAHDNTKEGLRVRRMVLHAVDEMVQSFMQRVEMDSRLCNALFRLCHNLFPFKPESDPQCARWLAKSHLPSFVEAVRTKRLPELRLIAYCEDAYGHVRGFLRTVKDSQRSLKFLDDDLFASSFGMEVISENLRRRLSIAGVWTSEASKACVVRDEDKSAVASIPVATPSRAGGGAPMPARRDKPAVHREPRRSVLDIDVNALAQQMTLLQHYMFSRIKVSELLVSKKSAERTPAYDRVRQLHNHLSLWVVTEILQRNDADERALVLAHLIKVAGMCFSPLQNFDGFMAIMNATNDSSVFRLKKTWSRLPPHVWDQWHDLKKCTEYGARAMNKIMRDCRPPCNPYLGVIMQNVIAIQEFPDRLEGDLINFKKIRVLGNLVQQLLMMQKTPYLLPVDKRVMDHMCRPLLYADPDARYRQSLAIEPRVSSSPGLAAPANQWALYQRL